MDKGRYVTHQKGFSLVELLIAISLLAVGLLAVASMQTTAIGANNIAGKHTAVTALAQEVLEDIMAWTNDDPRLAVASVNTPYDLDLGSTGTSLTIPNVGTFNATYSITPNAVVKGAPVPKLTRIDVTVTMVGAPQTARFTCYKELSS